MTHSHSGKIIPFDKGTRANTPSEMAQYCLTKTSAERPRRNAEAFRETPHGRESGFGYIVFASALLELKLRDNGIRCKSLANELAER